MTIHESRSFRTDFHDYERVRFAEIVALRSMALEAIEDVTAEALAAMDDETFMDMEMKVMVICNASHATDREYVEALWRLRDRIVEEDRRRRN